MRPGDGADADRVWQTVCGEITHLLAEHTINVINIERTGRRSGSPAVSTAGSSL